MERTFEIIFLTVPLIAGAIAILMTYRLMRKYRLSYINSYFYFLVFLYIFGSYSLIGSGLLEQLLMRIGPDSEIAWSARLYALLPGIPFLVLSKYMFFRGAAEMAGKNLNRILTIVFFAMAMAGFFLYGFFLVRLTRFGQGEYFFFLGIQKLVFVVFILVVYLAAFLSSVIFSSRLPAHERKFSRKFFAWYLPYMVLVSSTFMLSGLYEFLSYVFIFLFLSWHLIPVFFLNLHLGNYHGEPTLLQKNVEEQLSVFCRKYEISKREREVIILLCKGLSNQEISDTLFISLQTVKDHVHRIFTKTGVKNRIQLANLVRSPTG
jgi:DNA-binding CsgD family transcriptional regulator